MDQVIFFYHQPSLFLCLCHILSSDGNTSLRNRVMALFNIVLSLLDLCSFLAKHITKMVN